MLHLITKGSEVPCYNHGGCRLLNCYNLRPGQTDLPPTADVTACPLLAPTWWSSPSQWWVGFAVHGGRKCLRADGTSTFKKKGCSRYRIYSYISTGLNIQDWAAIESYHWLNARRTLDLMLRHLQVRMLPQQAKIPWAAFRTHSVKNKTATILMPYRRKYVGWFQLYFRGKLITVTKIRMATIWTGNPFVYKALSQNLQTFTSHNADTNSSVVAIGWAFVLCTATFYVYI